MRDAQRGMKTGPVVLGSWFSFHNSRDRSFFRPAHLQSNLTELLMEHFATLDTSQAAETTATARDGEE